MSGLEVIGGVAALIDIIDASIKIYKGARKDLELSEAFKLIGLRLPIILDTLATCKDHLETSRDSLTAEVCDALENIMDDCKEKARKLRDIFAEVIPCENESRNRRYLKLLKRLGKGSKVEELMLSLVEDVQHLVNHHAVKSATTEQMANLSEIIKELKSVESSTQVAEGSGMTFNSAGGDMENYFNNANGNMVINHERINTQHIGNVIHKQADDFSYRGPVGPCLGHAPYIERSYFVGRHSELDRMIDILQPGNKTPAGRRLVLGGMGGIGKTQLAITYALQQKDDYTSIFWLNAASETVLNQSLKQVAGHVFNTQEPEMLKGEQIILHINQWLSDRKNTRWLLIFDNYDDPDSFKIEKYYPVASHGSILITTRRPDLVAGRELHLEPLEDIEDGLRILATRSQRKDTTTDCHAKCLAERFRGLPLALATAGAYLGKSTLTFECYLQEYEERWCIDPERPLQLQEYQDRTLYTTWDISYDRLKNEDPNAAKLLKLLAYFDNESLWYDLFHAGFTNNSPEWLHEIMGGEVNFDSAMRRLVGYCFIETQQEAASWSLHTCVHDWTMATLNQVIDTEQYWYAFDCVAFSIDGEDLDNFRLLKFGRIAAHAKRLLHDRFQQSQLDGDNLCQRLRDAFSIAALLQQQLQFEAAVRIYRMTLAGYEQELGPEHISTLHTVNNLAVLYANQGKLGLAEQYYIRALAGSEKALGPEHTSTLDTVNNLANLYRQQGKLSLAEQYYERALAGCEKALGPEHTSTLLIVNNLAILYEQQGKLSLAEQYYERALTGCEKTLGPEHISTLNTVNNLADLYEQQGKLSLAEQYYERALTGCEKALGPEHISTLNTVNNLAVLYAGQGKLSLAEQYYERALAGCEKALGPEHTSTLLIVNNLANLYRQQGKLSLAEQYYERALTGCEKVLGPEHISTLNTANNLANLYNQQGKLNLAEQYYERALVGYEKALGPEHISTLLIVNNLAVLYAGQGKLGLAEQHYQRALAGYQKALQSDTIPALNAAYNIAILYQDQGYTKKAAPLVHRAMMGFETILGPEHPKTIKAIEFWNELRAPAMEDGDKSIQANENRIQWRKRDRIKAFLRLGKFKEDVT